MSINQGDFFSYIQKTPIAELQPAFTVFWTKVQEDDSLGFGSDDVTVATTPGNFSTALFTAIRAHPNKQRIIDCFHEVLLAHSDSYKNRCKAIRR